MAHTQAEDTISTSTEECGIDDATPVYLHTHHHNIESVSTLSSCETKSYQHVMEDVEDTGSTSRGESRSLCCGGLRKSFCCGGDNDGLFLRKYSCPLLSDSPKPKNEIRMTILKTILRQLDVRNRG